MKKAGSILLNLDLFGSEAKLSVKKQYQHKTFLGAFVSLTIIVFILYSFFLLVNDMLYYQVPSVIQIQKFNPNPDLYELSPEDFYFATSVVNNYGIPVIQTLNQTIFTAEAEHCHRSSVIQNGLPFYQSVCQTLIMIPCYEANLDAALIKQINPPSQLFNLLYCINSTEWKLKGLALQGTGQSPEYQTLNLKVKPCVNDTQVRTGKTCASQEVIDANINQGYVAISFPDRILDQQATGDPYSTVNKLIVAAITNTEQNNKNLYINLRHSQTSSFKNFFFYFGSEVQNHELVFDSFQESTESTNKTQILGCLFQLDDRQNQYERNYYDFLRVLANLGGLVNLLFFLGNMVIRPISKLSLDLNLVNQIFSFQNESVSSQIKQSLRESNGLILRDITIGQDNNFKQNKDFQKNMHFLKGFFQQKLHSLRLGFSDYMFQCFSSPKTQQIQVGVQKLNQKLDVIFLIKKLIEIDKLKILLLNSEQIKLFDYIPKPHIPYISSDFVEELPLITNQQDFKYASRKDFDLFQTEKPFVENVQNAFEAYKKLSSKNVKNKISHKLIELMDSEIKMLFDHTIDCNVIKYIPVQYKGQKGIEDSYESQKYPQEMDLIMEEKVDDQLNKEFD